MTFLIRVPKLYLSPLSMSAIVSSYKLTLKLNDEVAINCAKLTKRYAFAFQLLGYLMFENHVQTIDDNILNKFDQYLDEFTYSKIWSTLTLVEQKILSSFKSNDYVPVSNILEEANIKKEYFSRYRDRLIKKGLIDGTKHGYVIFILPRFYEFIVNKLMFEN